MGKSPGAARRPWWTRRRSMVLDVGLAALAALECAVGAYALVGDRLHGGLWAELGAALLGALAGATLVVRRRWPVVPVVAALVFVPALFGVVLLVVSLYSLAATWEWPSRRWRVLGLSALAYVESVGMLMLSFFTADNRPGETQPPAWVLILVAVLVAVGLTVPPVVTGLYVGARRRLIESLKDRAHGLETELDLLAEQAQERARRARLEERTRIAREMHDVVAHRVSLMVVHASALERIVDRDPQKAKQSAALMGEVGRQALNELREILGVLRMSEETVERTPGLGGLPGLVAQSEAAGMRVSLTVKGECRAYVPEAEQTAFRVVQEGLTNAHKHASGARVCVLLSYVPNGVRVLVANDCPGSGVKVALPSGGNGLLGMRERVLALGGSFSAGADGKGGFLVEAFMPSRLAAREQGLAG
ncbi:sensor histidine kinase [Kitasatospora sp. MMS16-BH015]|uniref:sensor histidine kinase n=1 Tax=Kitasatospora sp. MMS16-BH015 TaxID=2018025 RepID=UPI000CA3C9D6|nr:histidine kinase [Kitasatospora sp. MMS16-BH015]AUG79366.1 sensor histidine kinase [Kitasatospora sp. MMS16-BH015]